MSNIDEVVRKILQRRANVPETRSLLVGVSGILSVSPNNLWVLLHRSRTKLRQLLEANWFSRRAAAA
ncbi:MAG TPA: hypothetical protein VGK82_09065 [Pyrinomonadaceae bacterium]